MTRRPWRMDRNFTAHGTLEMCSALRLVLHATLFLCTSEENRMHVCRTRTDNTHTQQDGPTHPPAPPTPTHMRPPHAHTHTAHTHTHTLVCNADAVQICHASCHVASHAGHQATLLEGMLLPLVANKEGLQVALWAQVIQDDREPHVSKGHQGRLHRQESSYRELDFYNSYYTCCTIECSRTSL